MHRDGAEGSSHVREYPTCLTLLTVSQPCRDLLCGGPRLVTAPQVVRDIATLVAIRTLQDRLTRLGPRGLPLACAEVWAPRLAGSACSPAAAAADSVRGPATALVCAILDSQVSGRQPGYIGHIEISFQCYDGTGFGPTYFSTTVNAGGGP